jgi:choline dehydrogenase-like flavoprotein
MTNVLSNNPFRPEEVVAELRRNEPERDAVTTYWHECGTAKMGRDSMWVVGGHLKVYGIDNLRVADASIMPRITAPTPWPPA